jgi:predicted enzyme related to lactoylglutathione lyase
VGPIIRNVAFDCADPYQLALFWSEVVGQPLTDDSVPGEPEAAIVMPAGPAYFFQRVPEAKSVKNRVHVCLQPDVPRETEVERVLALGATMLEDHRLPDGTGWVVLADPEGNEFCILRSAAERAATTPAG